MRYDIIYIYIYVIRRLKVKECMSTSIDKCSQTQLLIFVLLRDVST